MGKVQYPFKGDLGMIVGETGITPMIQALHAILGADGDVSKVSMLYGSRTEADILCKETLDAWNKSHGDRLAVKHVLSHEPETSAWVGDRGFIGQELLTKCLPPPSTDCLIFV